MEADKGPVSIELKNALTDLVAFNARRSDGQRFRAAIDELGEDYARSAGLDLIVLAARMPLLRKIRGDLLLRTMPALARLRTFLKKTPILGEAFVDTKAEGVMLRPDLSDSRRDEIISHIAAIHVPNIDID